MILPVSDYNIVFGNAGASINDFLKDKGYSSIFVIVDNNTELHCLPQIESHLPDHHVVTISAGEEHKNLDTCHDLWSGLKEGGADRHSLVIDLGGGVIGDMGGFVASTYMRGVDFIQVPTTLLSQVDASVGGKLGVDFNGLKNFIGMFRDPQAVIVDSAFFDTLPEDELRSGYAEMIKHALIQDKNIWNGYVDNADWKYNLKNPDLMASVDIKRKVVLEDPFEKSKRKILNFGHTLGHAIETYSFETRTPLLHGYAIALGMIGEAWLSKEVSGLKETDYQSIKKYIKSVYDFDPSLYKDTDAIMENMKHDKKNKGGKVMFSLLQTIGNCGWDVEVDRGLVLEALSECLASS